MRTRKIRKRHRYREKNKHEKEGEMIRSGKKWGSEGEVFRDKKGQEDEKEKEKKEEKEEEKKE